MAVLDPKFTDIVAALIFQKYIYIFLAKKWFYFENSIQTLLVQLKQHRFYMFLSNLVEMYRLFFFTAASRSIDKD